SSGARGGGGGGGGLGANADVSPVPNGGGAGEEEGASFFPGWSVPASSTFSGTGPAGGGAASRNVVDLGSIGGDMGHRALPLAGDGGSRGSGGGGGGGGGGVGQRARATTETTSLPDSGRKRSFSLSARGEPEAAAAAAAAAAAGAPWTSTATGGAPMAVGGNIVDVIVVHGSDPVPPGYSKLERSSGGKRADLNTGARGQYVYLAVKRDTPLVDQAEGDDVSHPGGGRMVGVPAVVALALIFPDRGETVPPMFQKVRRRGTPVDLNAGTNGERSFLCYKRGTTNPITDIQVRGRGGRGCGGLDAHAAEPAPKAAEAEDADGSNNDKAAVVVPTGNGSPPRTLRRLGREASSSAAAAAAGAAAGTGTAENGGGSGGGVVEEAVTPPRAGGGGGGGGRGEAGDGRPPSLNVLGGADVLSQTFSEPPSPTNEHDEDADVLDASGLGGDGWETRRACHSRRNTFGQGLGDLGGGGGGGGGDGGMGMLGEEDIFADE
ncbi:unnamed protein product, partial [Ectocarpus fasciculatus]